MSIYADLSDEDLATEIATLRARIRNVAVDAPVKSVTGEGRRIEFEGSSTTNLQSLLRQALEEQARRDGSTGGAIGVAF